VQMVEMIGIVRQASSLARRAATPAACAGRSVRSVSYKFALSGGQLSGPA